MTTPKGLLITLLLSVFGYMVGLLPALITGLAAAFFLNRLRPLFYVPACVAASLLTCVSSLSAIFSGLKPTGMGEVILYIPIASTVAALACALLTLRRTRDATAD